MDIPPAAKPARPAWARKPALLAVDLIEHAAVGEVRLLGFLPAAEDLVDGEQLHIHELLGVFLGRFRVPRPVEVFAGDVLALG